MSPQAELLMAHIQKLIAAGPQDQYSHYIAHRYPVLVEKFDGLNEDGSKRFVMEEEFVAAPPAVQEEAEQALRDTGHTVGYHVSKLTGKKLRGCFVSTAVKPK